MFNDPEQYTAELEARRAKYLKAMEQGRKIEYLTSLDEWRFFEGWLLASIDEITKQIMRGDYLTNQRAEDFNKGVVAGMQMLIDGAAGFKGERVRAEKKLDDLKKYEEAGDE